MEDNVHTTRPYPRRGASNSEESVSAQIRMQRFLSRIAQNGLYDAICYVMTSPPPKFTVTEPDDALGFAHFSRTVAQRIEGIRNADDDAITLGKMLAEREDIDDILSGITSTPRGLSAAEASIIQRRRHLVGELQRLALAPESNETTMQTAIGKNYWLFGGQYIGMAERSIVAHDQYDIPLISADGSLHIVELKGPESKLVKEHRGSLIVANQVHEAASQCLNYLRALDDRLPEEGHRLGGCSASTPALPGGPRTARLRCSWPTPPRPAERCRPAALPARLPGTRQQPPRRGRGPHRLGICDQASGGAQGGDCPRFG